MVLKRVSDDVYGCDQCKKPITDDRLEFTVFFDHADAERHEVCSWACAIKLLRKMKTNYFISLPYLHYDRKAKGIRAKDFFALFNK